MGYQVLLTEEIDQTGKDFLQSKGYTIRMGSGIDEATVIAEAADCDAILTRNAKITEKVLRACKKLRVVSMHGVGVDIIDVQAATKLGIAVTNAAQSNSGAVAEFTIGLIIDLARNILLYDQELRKGNWAIRGVRGTDLQGKTLGLIGMGNIGTQVAQKAALGLGMRVIGYKRRVHPEHKLPQVELTQDMDAVLKQADFLSVHVPSTPSTAKLINQRALSLMKPSAYFINTARGEVVDEQALYEALKENRLAGAALDVFQGEIPAVDHPLLSLKNVIVTPHAAAFTRETVARMALHAAMGVDEILSGRAASWPVNHVASSIASASV